MIALCLNIPALDDGVYTEQTCKPFIGAGWIPHFAEMCKQQQIPLLSGRQAIESVKRGTPISQLKVLQEEIHPQGLGLITAGAEPTLLMCFESPLYAYTFYDALPQMKADYKNTMLFEGGTHHSDFCVTGPPPTKHLSFNQRQMLCMISANKHYANGPTRMSTSWREALHCNLHDYRYEAIEFFAKDPHLFPFHLYGHGWPDILKHGPCEDKIETLSQYKFSLVFENVTWPGYVTEKIMDCFLAGTVPIYMGAPDIDTFVPKNLFIDARNYSFRSLKEYLASMSSESWAAYIARAADWGQHLYDNRFSQRGVAKKIFELVTA